MGNRVNNLAALGAVSKTCPNSTPLIIGSLALPVRAKKKLVLLRSKPRLHSPIPQPKKDAERCNNHEGKYARQCG
jgi:hypothetical protein